MNARKMPVWLKVLLVLVALVVLGPPALALAVGSIAVLVVLAGAGIKLGLLALAIYVIWRGIRAIAGGDGPGTPQKLAPTLDELASNPAEADLEHQDRLRKAELDRELDLALRERRLPPGAPVQ